MSAEEIPSGRHEITVDELVDRCNQAAKSMGVSNPHRTLILNVGRALYEVTMRLQAEQRMVGELVRFSSEVDKAEQAGKEFWQRYGEGALTGGASESQTRLTAEYSAIENAMNLAIEGVVRTVRLMLNPDVQLDAVKKSGIILPPGMTRN